MGSSSTTGPSPAEVAFNGQDMVALSLQEEDLELGEDFFIWPHPTNSSEALFVVDDAAERAMRETASWSHEGVRAALSEMSSAITVVA